MILDEIYLSIELLRSHCMFMDPPPTHRTNQSEQHLTI